MDIKERNIALAVVLTIVTCGIYGIYWLVMLAKESVSVKDASDSAVLEIVLMILFYPAGFYLAEKKFAEGCAEKGIAHNDNSILYLVLGLCVPGIGIYINSCVMQNDLNKLANPTA